MFSMSKSEARFLGFIICLGLFALALMILGAVGGVCYLLFEGVKAVFGL